MFWKIVLAYVVITAINFIINGYRMLHTNYLWNTYLVNIKNKTEDKNYELLIPLMHIFKKANVCIDERYIRQGLLSYNDESKLEEALKISWGYYKYLTKHSCSWFFRIPIPTFKFIKSKTKNKLIQFISFILSSFIIYLIGLYLDDSGLGLKILNLLSHFLKALF